MIFLKNILRNPFCINDLQNIRRCQTKESLAISIFWHFPLQIVEYTFVKLFNSEIVYSVLEYKKKQKGTRKEASPLLLAAISWAEKVLFTWDQVEECEFGFVLNHLSFEFW